LGVFRGGNSVDRIDIPEEETMRIAVQGATGYQAGLVLDELSRRGLAAVLIGRDPDRLGAVGPPDVERRTAALDDPAALAGCAVVINCAGPFTPAGPAVARAAVAAGVHYVDTAGEQLFVKALFDELGAAAESAGVAVVPATTDAALPTDLLAHLVADRVGPAAEITSTHLITGGGGMSRGSLRSFAAAAETFASGGLEYGAGGWRPGGPGRRTVTGPDGAPLEVTRFPMVEVVTVPRHVPARRVEGLVDAALGDRFAAPPAPGATALPAGPAEADRREQRFTYLVDATGEDGRAARGVVRGSDTYGSTAVIAVEAARRLATGAAAGVLAAAQAFDPADFLGFLAGRGLTTTITSGAPAPGKLRVPPE
jgi:short subunit dehydrogenase-like uncharacterized protein